MNLTKNKEREEKTRSDDKKCLYWFKKKIVKHIFVGTLFIVSIIINIIYGTKMTNNLNYNEALDISYELYNKIPLNIRYNIEDWEIMVNPDNILITIQLKGKGDYTKDKMIAYIFVQKILEILIAKGRNLYAENLLIMATPERRVKDAIGQDLIFSYGYAVYNPSHDTIEWEDNK